MWVGGVQKKRKKKKKDVVGEGGGGVESGVHRVDVVNPRARTLWWRWVMPHGWCCNGPLR